MISFIPYSDSSYSFNDITSFAEEEKAYGFTSALKESGGDLPGDSSTTATLAGGADFGANMDSETDVDWFRLDVSAGLNYRIAHQGPSTINQEIIDFTAQSDATYYVAISASPTHTGGYDSTFPGTYFLNYVEDEYSAGTNTTAILTTDTTVNGALQGASDIDWVAFNVTTDEDYIITLGGVFQSPGVTDPAFLIVDATGVEIPTTSFINEISEASFEFTADITGTYYVVLNDTVLPDTAFGMGDYSLTASNQASDTPGDSSTNVNLNTLGDQVFDTLDSPGDSDWFRVNVTTGEIVDFFVSYSSQTSVSLNLYSAAGELLASGTDRSNQFATALDDYEFGTAGEYFIEVADNGNGIGSYFLSAYGTPVDVPGDSSTTSTLIVDGTSISGLYDASEDTDWYVFSGVEGEATQINVDWLMSSSDGDIGLYDTNGSQISTSSNRDIFVFEASYTGTYFIEITGNSQIGIGAPYVVNLTSIEDDFAGAATTTGSIIFADSAQSGVINYSGDQDWFAFTLQPDEVALFDVSNTVGALNVTIVDANGPQILTQRPFLFQMVLPCLRGMKPLPMMIGFVWI